MKKVILFLVLSLTLSAVIGLAGCGGSSTTPPIEEDFINIISVTPDSGLVDGVDTDFTVIVEYNLYSYTQGVLKIGFNNQESINSFRMVSNADFLVNKGFGTHEFNVTVIPKDWGSQGNFKVYVNISEYPHPSTWTPLDGDTRVLTFTVSDDNHAPVITTTSLPDGTVGTAYTATVNATDADGDTLVYSLTTKPSGMSINSSTGLIAWTPTATGSFGVTVKVSDGELFDTQSYTITVSESIPAPLTCSLTANPPSININETTTITITHTLEECIICSPLYYTWNKNGGTFEGSTSGSSVIWRAPSTEGNYTVVCEVSNEEAICGTWVIISVGD